MQQKSNILTERFLRGGGYLQLSLTNYPVSSTGIFQEDHTQTVLYGGILMTGLLKELKVEDIKRSSTLNIFYIKVIFIPSI